MALINGNKEINGKENKLLLGAESSLIRDVEILTPSTLKYDFI